MTTSPTANPACEHTVKHPFVTDFYAAEGASLFETQNVIVVERRWYEQMKHTFPYSQWTVLDLYATYSQKAFVANRDTGSGVAQPMSVRIRDGGQGMKSSKK